MKKLIFTILLFGIVSTFLEEKAGRLFHHKETYKENTFKVTATMYYPMESQCDSTPLITAGMFHINKDRASSHKWIAASRDLLKRWGGPFNYGDYVEIKGAGKKDGIYRIVDTMNKRYRRRIDFLETPGTEQYKFENVLLALHMEK